MDLTLLDTLRTKLQTAKQFSEVMTYFLDHFGEVREFIALGKAGPHPFLEAVLAQVGKQLFGPSVTVTHVLLTRLPEHGFVHGTAFLQGQLTTVLYFEHDAVGLIAVATPGETKFARFTGIPQPRQPKPSAN
jgi:hypothetical protein